MKKNKFLAVLLVMAIALLLTACQVDIPGVGTLHISGDGKEPTGNNGNTGNNGTNNGNTGDEVGKNSQKIGR